MRLAWVCAGAILLCVYAPVASGEERVVKDSVAVARDLYSSAQYEEALGMLDRLRAASAPDDITPVEQYRAF